jgi:hypothetical protein
MPVLDPVLRKDREMDTKLVDGDYVLTEGAAWFTVKGFSIRIHSTDEGVVVDVYKAMEEMTDPVASTYAFDSEVEGTE